MSPSIALEIAKVYGIPEIWVAEGRYDEIYVLDDNLGMYGGFLGTETTLEERDIPAHPTTIFHTDYNPATFDILGKQNVTIDGAGLPSGTYAIRLTGETFSDALTVTLLK